MILLGIESSCDETSIAVVEDGRRVLSVETLSQIEIHKVYGGVVPEIASRKHLETIAGLAEEAIRNAGITKKDLSAIACTNRPGLIGALLTGLSFAKGAAYALGIPLVTVNHIAGHIAAAYLAFPELKPPFTALSVSGGNTFFIRVADYCDMTVLGSTRDDAAGEAFDKVARVLGIPYPGGKEIDRLAKLGREQYGVEECMRRFPLPRPVFEDAPYDTSFSGLKTAVINKIHTAEQKGEEIEREVLAASFCEAVADMLVSRFEYAVKAEKSKIFVVGGGVAANSRLRERLEESTQKYGVTLYVPPLAVCGDNAAMIASQGYYDLLAGKTVGLDENAYANLEYLSERNGKI